MILTKILYKYEYNYPSPSYLAAHVQLGDDWVSA